MRELYNAEKRKRNYGERGSRLKQTTQLDMARGGRISADMRRVAAREGVSAEFIRRGVAHGRIVIPRNRLRPAAIACGIGEGLRTKVNANIGTSGDSFSMASELAKMRASVELGADTVMDLSTGPRIEETLRKMLSECRVPLGTVPIYEIVIRGIERRGNLSGITVSEMFEVLERQAREGVDFFTIHAGVTGNVLDALRRNPRILSIVSRGGAFLAQWMVENSAENPFYAEFDRVLDIAGRYDVTISLGDGLRPGAIADATDAAQITELDTLGRLQKRAFRRGVQSMIEGPGHVPINEIEANVALAKSLCNGAPLYVLGPLVTDVAPGYDHITSAIGGAIAASKGADFLCYVTPSEHLRLPTLDDTKTGVIAARIAAHAADIAKGVGCASEWDAEISRARGARNWKRQFELAIDKTRPELYRRSSRPKKSDVCTMCGNFCSAKISREYFKKRKA